MLDVSRLSSLVRTFDDDRRRARLGLGGRGIVDVLLGIGGASTRCGSAWHCGSAWKCRPNERCSKMRLLLLMKQGRSPREAPQNQRSKLTSP